MARQQVRSKPSAAVHTNGNGRLPSAPAGPEQAAVIVTFKKSAPIAFEIDPDQLLWEDMMALSDIQARAARGELTEAQMMGEMADLLTRLTGQDMRKQPARVVNALFAEFQRIAGGGADAEKKDDN